MMPLRDSTKFQGCLAGGYFHGVLSHPCLQKMRRSQWGVVSVRRLCDVRDGDHYLNCEPPEATA